QLHTLSLHDALPISEGAIILPNQHGTAPGLAMEVKPNPYRSESAASWLVMLPGPPRELNPMFKEAVVPLLQRLFPLETLFVCRTDRKSTRLNSSHGS